MSSVLFCKWRRWLNRIYEDQLEDLLINQHIFKQFAACTKPYKGRNKAADLAYWMNQGYVTFAATAIRRIVEKPDSSSSPRTVTCPKCKYLFPIRASKRKQDRSISMIVLLRDLKENSNLLTIQRFRRMYRNPIALRFAADRDFYKITRNKRATCLSANRIDRDIQSLKKVADPVRRLVNKVIAHTEEDRRRIVKLRYKQLDAAIEHLTYQFEIYSLLINGSYYSPLVPLHQYNVSHDLQQIWPSSEGRVSGN